MLMQLRTPLLLSTNSLLNTPTTRDMSGSNRTNIPVKPETADELYKFKKRGESWDDVVRRRLLNDESRETATESA